MFFPRRTLGIPGGPVKRERAHRAQLEIVSGSGRATSVARPPGAVSSRMCRWRDRRRHRACLTCMHPRAM